MALKQLQLRIVSTQNIEKITASMKMVAAAKMKGTPLASFQVVSPENVLGRHPEATWVPVDVYLRGARAWGTCACFLWVSFSWRTARILFHQS